MLRAVDRILSAIPLWRRARNNAGLRGALGFEHTIWTRKAADEAVRALIAPLRPETLSALEISGEVWRADRFASYRNTRYPELDITREALDEQFDLVIAEHIFEHLARPYQAGRNVLRMVKPGGHFLMVTPFLYRVHPDPIDCTRWTETGLRYFLEECGFTGGIETGSWGNRAVIAATFRREFRLFNRHLHSLRNEPEYPIVVWALARAPTRDARTHGQASVHP